MSLLERMQFSADAMTLGDKFLGSMIVTFLGIGIVFAALLVLYFSIAIMQKATVKPEINKKPEPKPDPVVTEEETSKDSVDNTELVAVITAAIAASLNTSTHNIIVRNITRVEDTTPSWAKIGRMNQINNRY